MPESGMGNMTVLIVQIVAIVALFYFLMIRPQQKRTQEAARIRNSVKIGSEIVTLGGVVGKVVKITDDDVVISTGTEESKSTVTFRKTAISLNLTGESQEVK